MKTTDFLDGITVFKAGTYQDTICWTIAVPVAMRKGNNATDYDKMLVVTIVNLHPKFNHKHNLTVQKRKRK